MAKYAKTIFNIVYLIGVICVLACIIIFIFGPDELSNPNAMVPLSFSALILLIIGTIPMILACLAVYIFNNIKNSKHKIRNTILIFVPGFICLGCYLFFILGGIIINLFK
jgi:uncharacterized YccA/Bax inhibitor family protein